MDRASEDRPEPVLPPIYCAARSRYAPREELLVTDQPPEGTLLWSDEGRRLRLALALDAEGNFQDNAVVAIVAIVALGDAIGSLSPPVVAVTHRWPDGIEVNGGLVGGVTLDEAGASAAASRLVLGVEVAMDADPGEEPGRRPDLTSLVQEGCGEITAVRLLESFARHFLAWLHRWQEDGFAPARAAWNARGPGSDAHLAHGSIEGAFRGIGAEGELVIERDGAEIRLPLAAALAAGPSWSLA